MSEQRTKQDSTSEANTRLSEIKIVMIGGRELGGKEASGKSSAGNIILGRNAFNVDRRTARSVQASAHVHGRHVTVVDTPGWWWHYTVENTPRFDRLEIIKSPTLCAPGPHAFLLVIPVDLAFPSIYTMSLEEHLQFLSKDVWRHIILLFTSTEPCDESSLKNNVRKWPDLKHLFKSCHNRYHLLNINNKDDNTQVITLLENIEKMVAQSNGQSYQISQGLSEFIKKEKITNKRAKQKILTVGKKTTEAQADIKDGARHLTEIRIVIVGASWAARSSAGNIILGEEAFKVDESRTTVRCEVGKAEVHGRELTVVDTPGWYYNSPLENTSEMEKLEIRRSVYLCHSGPHAILLTVPIATAFNKSYQTAVKEHMSLLGETVWSHTIVLFTRGDWLGDTTIEERLETEEERFDWLMEQCGNRYQVLNCKQHNDSKQVVELLEKIEKMVMENNGCYYVPEISSNPTTDLEMKLKTASTNRIKVNKQRHMLKELLKERKYNLSDVRIVLLGEEGAGKSTLGNIILYGDFFESTLAEGYENHTRQCVMQQGKVEECQVSVVDTPGWSTSTSENAEMLRSLTLCSPGPHAFLLVLPVRGPYTEKSQQTVKKFRILFGGKIWRHTIIIFTEGHWLKNRPVEEYIACEGEVLQELVRMCENRYHVIENDWNNRSQVRNLLKMIEQMVARNRGEYFTLEKKAARSTVFSWFTGSKTLTEEEWMKREDELINRVLKAIALDLEEESIGSPHRLRGSLDLSIPNMSGDSLLDETSSVGADTLDPTDKVSRWLKRRHGASSGRGTMTTTSSFQDSNIESLKDDIPVLKHNPIEMKNMKYFNNMTEQKHSRSLSF